MKGCDVVALPIMLLIEFCLVYTILSIARNRGDTPTPDRYDTLVSISFGILTSAITQGISYFLVDYSNNEADAGEVLAVLGFVPAIILITQLCRFAKNKGIPIYNLYKTLASGGKVDFNIDDYE